MTIPRQVITRSYEGFDFVHLDARIEALENSTTAITGNGFHTRYFGVLSSKLANYVRNLEDRCAALEISQTKPVHMDLARIPRRTPLGKAIYDSHHRLTLLGG